MLQSLICFINILFGAIMYLYHWFVRHLSQKKGVWVDWLERTHIYIDDVHQSEYAKRVTLTSNTQALGFEMFGGAGGVR